MSIQSCYYAVTLSPTANNSRLAVLVSKGNNATTAARGAIALQNQGSVTGSEKIYIANSPFKSATESLCLYRNGNILRDIFTPADDIYAWSDTASAILSVAENYAGG